MKDDLMNADTIKCRQIVPKDGLDRHSIQHRISPVRYRHFFAKSNEPLSRAQIQYVYFQVGEH